MKKVLLTALNARYTHTNLALYYLRAVLQENNLNCSLLELNINEQPLAIISQISEFKPDILALSVYIWNSNLIKSILADLHAVLPQTRLILGGPEVSYNAGKWLEDFPFINHIVCGNGEEAIVELVQNETLPKIIKPESRPLDSLSFPYDNLPLENKDSRYFYYETSRGCPFRCSYCLSSRSDQALEYRSLDKVFRELDWFIANEVRHIKLVDRTFNADRKRAHRIWQYLLHKISEDDTIKSDFHFEIHPVLLADEDFELLSMIPVGYFRFEIGIQTLHKQTQEIIRREMDWQMVKLKLLRLSRMDNISLHFDLIAGLPGEDAASFGKGFDEVISIMPQHLQLGFLKILPGTLMSEIASEYGIAAQKHAPYQVLFTGSMSFDDLTLITWQENLLEIFYNSHRFSSFIKLVFLQQDSPWLFLKQMALYSQGIKADLRLKKWEKTARLLYDFCVEFKVSSLELIKDCLRFDFCRQARGHNFPDFLHHKNIEIARKIANDFLQQKKKDASEKITASDKRSAVCFLPVSDSFPRPNTIRLFTGLPGSKNYFEIPFQ